MRRREDGIAYSVGGRSRLAVLSTVVLKSCTLGKFECLRFSPNRRVCVCILVLAKNRTNIPIFHSFVAVFSWFGKAKPSRQSLPYTAPAVRRLCSLNSLIRGAFPKASAQKTLSAPRPTLAAADCCGHVAPFVDHQKGEKSGFSEQVACRPLFRFSLARS